MPCTARHWTYTASLKHLESSLSNPPELLKLCHHHNFQLESYLFIAKLVHGFRSSKDDRMTFDFID